jgi:beta-glucosidase
MKIFAALVIVLCSTSLAQQPDFVSAHDQALTLLSQMTLEEKVGQMIQIERDVAEKNPEVIKDWFIGSVLSGGGSAPRAGNQPQQWADLVGSFQTKALSTRLKIPLLYGIDAVHGHNNVYGATIFPHNIGLGATRDPALVKEIGRITAEEVYATGIRWTFSPCLCVARDERWGRTYESFGESPELAVMMSTIIEGYQGNKLSDKGSILATAKHFLGDGGTTYGTGAKGKIDQGDTRGNDAALQALFLPPFVAAIQKGVGSVMPSFSSWNGIKMHAQKDLIEGVLKNKLQFDGFVISDWQAIDQIPGSGYAQKVATSVNAGVDMLMVPYDYQGAAKALISNVKNGAIQMARIDDAVVRILTKKYQLGLFEQALPDTTNINQIGSVEHRKVARQAVAESLVLLKNKNNLLPLAKNAKILVTGSHMDDIGLQSGGWTKTWQGQAGAITPGTTILQGLRQVAPNAKITTLENPRKQDLGTQKFDLGVIVVGERPYAETDGDNPNLELDGVAEQSIRTVCAAMRCVVILVTGRPVNISSILPLSHAVVAAWLPGSEGAGIADVLFGDQGFVGTLPMSWFKSVNQLPINVGDAKYDPLFAYGYGLKYISK